MCVVESCAQPVGESPTLGNGTPEQAASGCSSRESSRYRVLGVASRGAGLSVDRNCVGRNAPSVKVSSPDNNLRGGGPSMKQGTQHRRPQSVGAAGVQVHGMYRRLSTEHKRSASSRGRSTSDPSSQSQGLKAKVRVILQAEVRCPHSSEAASRSGVTPVERRGTR
jgi:hypothetical protein